MYTYIHVFIYNNYTHVLRNIYTHTYTHKYIAILHTYILTLSFSQTLRYNIIKQSMYDVSMYALIAVQVKKRKTLLYLSMRK